MKLPRQQQFVCVMYGYSRANTSVKQQQTIKPKFVSFVLAKPCRSHRIPSILVSKCSCSASVRILVPRSNAMRKSRYENTEEEKKKNRGQTLTRCRTGTSKNGFTTVFVNFRDTGHLFNAEEYHMIVK